MRRSKHNLSYGHKTTCDNGELIPLAAVEVIPGDTFVGRAQALIRVTPTLRPLMHKVEARIHHFFVPNRILWDGWEDHITNKSAGTIPTITGGAHSEGTLQDYLGIYDDASTNLNALPFRAYNTIFNEYYRDDDLVSEVSVDSETIQKVAWPKDYFTAARTSPQSGSAVSLPLGTSADIKYHPNFASGGTFADDDYVVQEISAGSASVPSYGTARDTDTGDLPASSKYNLYADLSNATAATIEQLREAFALQKFAEARNNWGDNYIDYLRYCGIGGPLDARLQRPEYLAGGKVTLSFSEVLDTNGASTLGDMAGHGIAAIRSNKYAKFFPEHGWFMTMLSIVPEGVYTEECPKKYTKTAYTDYWQKELEGIGDQPILNRELYAAHSSPTGTWGYAPQYQEYRQERNIVTAEMRNSTNYDFHMARIFAGDQALNSTFVTCNPSKRVYADQTEDSYWINAWNTIKARRAVSGQPWYATL